MNITDALFNPFISNHIRAALFDYVMKKDISDSMLLILKPTAENDDVNGSTHVSNGGTNFTYEDVDEQDVNNATSLGYYEHFSRTFDHYTGHYYEGDGYHFAAIVIDPPEYAIDTRII